MCWTKEEVEFLTNNYEHMSYIEIAKRLNKTSDSIKLKCKRLGLRKEYKSTSKILEAFGTKKSAKQWSKDNRCVVSYETLLARIRGDWDLEEAITTPSKTNMKIGEKINQLTLRKLCGIENGLLMGEFVCDCDNQTIIYRPISYIQRGRIKSCSCANAKKNHEKFYKHGEGKTRLYVIWSHIKQRCYNPKCKDYKWYGAIGVTMCEEWKNNFLTFKEWAIDNGYCKNLTIDRINPQCNYEPTNCRWIANEDQNNNKRKTIIIEAFGERKTIKDWSNDPRCAVDAKTLRSRIYNKTSPEIAITTKSSRL